MRTFYIILITGSIIYVVYPLVNIYFFLLICEADHQKSSEEWIMDSLQFSENDLPNFLKLGEIFKFRINILNAKKFNSSFTDIFCQYRLVILLLVAYLTIMMSLSCVN